MLEFNFEHHALIVEFGIKDGEEELAVVFHILQFEILHGDGFGAVFIGSHSQFAAFCDITCLGLEVPEVTIESDVDTWEGWQIRCADVAEVVLAVNDLSAEVADDEETFAVSRHEEHRLDIET